MLAGAVTFGCASEESETAPASDPASPSAAALAPGGSALPARDMAKKRFDETPPPKASRKR